MRQSTRDLSIRSVAFILVAMLLVAMLPVGEASADESREVVRVGWYESPFNATDEQGRRSGYAYDYQQKVAAHTGWQYEYVEGSWSDLLQMLRDGKIDLLSDVSYTDERAEHILYSTLPMGTEEYYLFVARGNEEISPEDFATLNGKKVGAQKGSVQIGVFNDWAQANGVHAEVVELTGSEEENIDKLSRGEIDMYLSLDGFFDKGTAVPLCKVGDSDYFFAVSKSRPELLADLNAAMNRIQDEDQYYNQKLYAKYLQSSSVNNFLNASEREWLEVHGPIRVGYQDNYLAFCAKDPDTGELTGALKDWMDAASANIDNAELEFTPVCYPSAAAAMEAMGNGEVDCVFPANLTAYDGEMRDVLITSDLMRTDMAAVIRQADQRSFASKARVSVAVNADNPNYDLFLQEHFPNWRPIYYEDTQACLKAVADGEADCLLISNYRYNNIAKTCERYGLTTWSTGVEMDYCLAVNRTDTTLYAILSKAAAVVPESTINAALTHYYSLDAKANVRDKMSQVLPYVVACVLPVAALVALFVLARGVWMDRKGGRDRQKIPTKEDFALLDDLPLSYSVYHVTKAEHSELYDAEFVYVNKAFAKVGGVDAEEVIGHHVRELFPYIEEEWFQIAKSAAIDGVALDQDYTDPLGGKTFRLTSRRVVAPGYCAMAYLQTNDAATPNADHSA